MCKYLFGPVLREIVEDLARGVKKSSPGSVSWSVPPVWTPEALVLSFVDPHFKNVDARDFVREKRNFCSSWKKKLLFLWNRRWQTRRLVGWGVFWSRFPCSSLHRFDYVLFKFFRISSWICAKITVLLPIQTPPPLTVPFVSGITKSQQVAFGYFKKISDHDALVGKRIYSSL